VSRLVAVSNRISVPRRGTAPGGLAVGVLAAMKARGGLWFGWSGHLVDGDPMDPELTMRGNTTYATIDLREIDHELYYMGFCNGALWPLFHYFLDASRYRDEQYEAYQRVNRQFAESLLPLLDPGDIIWIHDYHLIPLARELRARGCEQAMGFFLHIPFPHVEVLRALPVYGELMRDMMHYDVVGFQTKRDLHSFRSAAQELWGVKAMDANGCVNSGGRRTRAGVYPIGVDVDEIQRESIESQEKAAVKRVRALAGVFGRSRVIGVDRLDYSKGLLERFEAYERFLETYPENLNRVSYLQIAPHSRGDIREYAEIRQQLEQASGRTNGRFADLDWTPIRYLNRNFPHDVLMGFMRQSQACLVTPVRDGMNLVAKEFVAAQDADDPGMLVLSTLAGAAAELNSALLVNPNDIRGVAHAIQQALIMPIGERRERHQQMLATLRANDIHAWHTRFIDDLVDSSHQR
jgi:trehalose 6-phosphate synthase